MCVTDVFSKHKMVILLKNENGETVLKNFSKKLWKIQLGNQQNVGCLSSEILQNIKKIIEFSIEV